MLLSFSFSTILFRFFRSALFYSQVPTLFFDIYWYFINFFNCESLFSVCLWRKGGTDFGFLIAWSLMNMGFYFRGRKKEREMWDFLCFSFVFSASKRGTSFSVNFCDGILCGFRYLINGYWLWFGICCGLSDSPWGVLHQC